MTCGILAVLALCSGLSYGASYIDQTEDLDYYPTDLDLEASQP